jgi:hypothetical protein
MACILLVARLRVCARPGMPWRHVPKVTVVGATGDARLRAVDEGVALVE